MFFYVELVSCKNYKIVVTLVEECILSKLPLKNPQIILGECFKQVEEHQLLTANSTLYNNLLYFLLLSLFLSNAIL